MVSRKRIHNSAWNDKLKDSAMNAHLRKCALQYFEPKCNNDLDLLQKAENENCLQFTIQCLLVQINGPAILGCFPIGLQQKISTNGYILFKLTYIGVTFIIMERQQKYEQSLCSLLFTFKYICSFYTLSSYSQSVSPDDAV